MPFGYLVARASGEVNPCMLLQINLGNVKERGVREIWQESPILAQLRSRGLLKGDLDVTMRRPVPVVGGELTRKREICSPQIQAAGLWG
ncbi:MAG: hypothetical protein E3J65_00710 [Dehalococcoidia bacterium]|nr:MAG: hypothetical protein E3J65_00710 [Dehalococcoidia bacterium]